MSKRGVLDYVLHSRVLLIILTAWVVILIRLARERAHANDGALLHANSFLCVQFSADSLRCQPWIDTTKTK